MTSVDATLDFEFKGNFEGHKVNWGQNVGFDLRDDLNLRLYQVLAEI